MAELIAEIGETVEEPRNETLDKPHCLCHLLESQILDDDKNGVLGSEPVFQNAFNAQERMKIKSKIFKLIEEL